MVEKYTCSLDKQEKQIDLSKYYRISDMSTTIIWADRKMDDRDIQSDPYK